MATRQSYAAHALPARLEFAELAQADGHEAGSLELTSRQVTHPRPEEVHRTLGPDLLPQLSQKSGLSVQDLAQKLAQVLPQAVDTMAPDGTIPKA